MRIQGISNNFSFGRILGVWLTLAGAALLITACGLVFADDSDPQNGTIRGKIHLEGVLVHSGVFINVPGTGRMATTDTDGNFLILDVPSGTHNLLVSRQGYRDFQQELTMGPGGDLDLGTLQIIKNQGRLSGTAQLEGEEDHLYVFVAIANSMYATFTVPNGSYSLENIPEGYYTITASRPGFAPASTPVVLVEDGKTTSMPLLILKGNFTLRGKIHAEGLLDQEGAMINVNGTGHMAVSDPEGDFVILGMSSGTHNVTVTRPGFRTSQQEVTLGAEEDLDIGTLDLDFNRGNASGTAQLQGAETHETIYVTIPGRMDGTFTVPNGGYHLDDLPEGYYTITASYPGYKTARSPVIHITDDWTESVPLMILEPE